MKNCLNIKVICTVCILLYSMCAQAQINKKPTWATPTFHYTLEKTYLEVVVMSGTNTEEVIIKAQNEIERRRKVMVGEKDPWIKSGHIAEYWETSKGALKGYFLYQTRKNPSYTPENISTNNTKYPFSPRVFIPGMAQIHKGQKGKGTMFIMGELSLVGGAIASQKIKSDYEAKIVNTKNLSLKQSYTDKANMCKNIGVGCVVGTAGLYLWSLIDGIVSEGRSYISVDDRAICLLPYTSSNAYGLTLCINY